MKTYPECYPCIVQQAVRAVEMDHIPQDLQQKAVKRVLQYLSTVDDTLSPSAIAGPANRILREVTGVDDFYLEEKEAGHQLAHDYLDDLKTLASQTNDSLEQALKIGAAGNVIDVVHMAEYNLWEEVTRTVSGPLVGGGLEEFRARMSSAPFLLILADNVGETIFDRVMIDFFNLPVVYSVKSAPILNDATSVDARAAGIDQVARIIENGTRSPGTVLDEVSDEFRELFDQASLVLSKGQANYETMDREGDKVFYLLRVKCPRLSKELDAPMGSLVFKQGQARPGVYS
jgi:uncharacterized protein with ATP-grasp and redox domains